MGIDTKGRTVLRGISYSGFACGASTACVDV